MPTPTIEVITGLMTFGNLLLLLKISFAAGQLVERQEDHEKRIARLEDAHPIVSPAKGD